MKIPVIITTILITQVSASFFDVFQGAVQSVQNSFGKLLSDVVTDVRDTVDCTILAVEHVLSLSDDATARYRDKCGSGTNKTEAGSDTGKDETVPNLQLSLKISNNEEYLRKEIPAEIDAKINETLSKVLGNYNSHDNLLSIENVLAKESEQLAEVSYLVKEELNRLSNEVNADLKNIEQRGNPSVDSILAEIKLLEEREHNTKNYSEANEIHKVIDEVLEKLDEIEATEATENGKLEVILKDLENKANTSFLGLRQQFEDWKEEESRHLGEIKNKMEKHDNIADFPGHANINELNRPQPVLLDVTKDNSQDSPSENSTQIRETFNSTTISSMHEDVIEEMSTSSFNNPTSTTNSLDTTITSAQSTTTENTLLSEIEITLTPENNAVTMSTNMPNDESVITSTSLTTAENKLLSEMIDTTTLGTNDLTMSSNIPNDDTVIINTSSSTTKNKLLSETISTTTPENNAVTMTTNIPNDESVITSTSSTTAENNLLSEMISSTTLGNNALTISIIISNDESVTTSTSLTTAENKLLSEMIDTTTPGTNDLTMSSNIPNDDTVIMSTSSSTTKNILLSERISTTTPENNVVTMSTNITNDESVITSTSLTTAENNILSEMISSTTLGNNALTISTNIPNNESIPTSTSLTTAENKLLSEMIDTTTPGTNDMTMSTNISNDESVITAKNIPRLSEMISTTTPENNVVKMSTTNITNIGNEEDLNLSATSTIPSGDTTSHPIKQESANISEQIPTEITSTIGPSHSIDSIMDLENVAPLDLTANNDITTSITEADVATTMQNSLNNDNLNDIPISSTELSIQVTYSERQSNDIEIPVNHVLPTEAVTSGNEESSTVTVKISNDKDLNDSMINSTLFSIITNTSQTMEPVEVNTESDYSTPLITTTNGLLMSSKIANATESSNAISTSTPSQIISNISFLSSSENVEHVERTILFSTETPKFNNTISDSSNATLTTLVPNSESITVNDLTQSMMNAMAVENDESTTLIIDASNTPATKLMENDLNITVMSINLNYDSDSNDTVMHSTSPIIDNSPIVSTQISIATENQEVATIASTTLNNILTTITFPPIERSTESDTSAAVERKIASNNEGITELPPETNRYDLNRIVTMSPPFTNRQNAIRANVPLLSNQPMVPVNRPWVPPRGQNGIYPSMSNQKNINQSPINNNDFNNQGPLPPVINRPWVPPRGQDRINPSMINPQNYNTNRAPRNNYDFNNQRMPPFNPNNVLHKQPYNPNSAVPISHELSGIHSMKNEAASSPAPQLTAEDKAAFSFLDSIADKLINGDSPFDIDLSQFPSIMDFPTEPPKVPKEPEAPQRHIPTANSPYPQPPQNLFRPPPPPFAPGAPPADMYRPPTGLTTYRPMTAPNRRNNYNNPSPDYDSFFHIPQRNTDAHDRALREAKELIQNSKVSDQIINNVMKNKNNYGARSIFNNPRLLNEGK